MNRVRLPRSQAEAQGIPSQAIRNLLEEVKEHGLELHSLMLLRHGHVVAEGWWAPYAAELPHMLFSLSKSFTSTAIGFAVAEGQLSLNDRVVSFFPEDLPEEVSDHLAAMEIRHLLMMGTGHAQDTMDWLRRQENSNWVAGILQAPVEHPPGTHFVYNSGATYMLSAILQKKTGQPLLDYLKPRLLEPLDIFGAAWETCPRGIAVGGWGLSITTEDIAKFGQLYLQKGMWEGQRLFPESWVEEATSKHISNGDAAADSDWTQGYGYQFWRCRHGAYRGDGAFGQFCVVLPEQQAIVAITSGHGDMQAILNAVWKHLLPAFQSAPLPEDVTEANALTAALGSLKLDPLTHVSNPAGEHTLSGKEFRLQDNPDEWKSFSIRFEQTQAVATFETPHGRYTIPCGKDVWAEGTFRVRLGMDDRALSSFTWRDPDTLELLLRFVETPFSQTFLCRFPDQEVVLETKYNVNFGPDEWMTIRGRALQPDN